MKFYGRSLKHPTCYDVWFLCGQQHGFRLSGVLQVMCISTLASRIADSGPTLNLIHHFPGQLYPAQCRITSYRLKYCLLSAPSCTSQPAPVRLLFSEFCASPGQSLLTHFVWPVPRTSVVCLILNNCGPRNSYDRAALLGCSSLRLASCKSDKASSPIITPWGAMRRSEFISTPVGPWPRRVRTRRPGPWNHQIDGDFASEP